MHSESRIAVTFLFTDIEGSTRLWERQAKAMLRALGQHDRLLRVTIEEQGGTVIKNVGDGFYAVFRHPRQAVEAAVAAQWRLAQARWDPSLGPLRVRMGLLTGFAEQRQGDYFGRAVNRAARLCDAAHGGQILIAASTRDLILDDLPDDLSLVDLGSRRLRGMSRPEHIYQLKVSGLRSEFPPLRTREDGRYTLPAPPALLVGRERELDEIQRLLGERARLVTIVGPGGIGKTSLALEVARDLAAGFRDGAAFVSLAPLSESAAVVPAIARALRYNFQSGDSRGRKRQLLDYLRGKELLLVLDNFEHLLDAAPLLTEIVRTAPGVTLLTTSRERLELQTEQVYPLRGLAFSQWENLADARDDPAVQLFMHHAQRVRSSFTLRQEHLEPLQRIFQLVGGMPLAVILAAGWVNVLRPVEIAAEVAQSLDFLEATERDVPERHRNMRAIFEATWRRLNERERALFSTLSVFRGGFTQEAAAAVGDASPREMSRLIGHSLLTMVQDGRFEVHELLCQFGAEVLAENPEREKAARQRHSAYYCAFLQRQEQALKGPLSEETEAVVAADFENVRRAWNWAVDNAEDLVFQAQTTLGIFCRRQGRWDEGEGAFLYAEGRLAPRDAAHPRQMAELLAWGSLFVQARSRTMADELSRRAMACLAEAAAGGDDVRAERAFVLLIESFSYRQQPEVRLELLEESLSLYEELGMHWEMAWVHYDLARLYVRQAKYRLAHEQFGQALKLRERVGDRPLTVRSKVHVASSKAWMGQLAEAEEALREALVLCEESGDEWGASHGQWRLGEVLVLSGRFEEALRTLAKSREMFANWGHNVLVRSSQIRECWAILHLGRYEEMRRQIRLVLGGDGESGEPTHYHLGLGSFLRGSTALAQARIDQARIHLEESARIFRAARQPDEVAWAKAGLAFVALLAGGRATAKKHLIEALELRLFVPSLLALPAAALLLAGAGQAERAVELYALAHRHAFVANSRWFEAVAGRRLSAVAETLAAEVATAARKRGASRDLWETVDEVLQELKDTGL